MLNPLSNFNASGEPGDEFENGLPTVNPQNVWPDAGLHQMPPAPEKINASRPQNKEVVKEIAAMRAQQKNLEDKKKEDQKRRAAAVKKTLTNEDESIPVSERRTERLNGETDKLAQEMIGKGFPLLIGATEEVIHNNPFNDPRIKNDPPRYVSGRVDPEPYKNALGIGSKIVERHQSDLKSKRDLTPDEVRKIEINQLPAKDSDGGDPHAIYRHASQMSLLELHKTIKDLSFIRGAEWDAAKHHSDLIAVDESGNMLAVFETVFEGSELALASKKLKEELLAINVEANGTPVDYGVLPNPSKLPGNKPVMVKGKDYNVPALKIVWRPNQLITLADIFSMDGIVTDEENVVLDDIFADIYGQIDMIREGQEDWFKKSGRPINKRYEEKLNALEAKLQQGKPKEGLAKYKQLKAEHQARLDRELGMTNQGPTKLGKKSYRKYGQ